MQYQWAGIAVLAAALIGAAPLHAQDRAATAPEPSIGTAADPAAATTSPEPAPIQACCTIPALTPIEIEIVELVGSRTSRTGDRFAIRLAAPLVIDGREVLPAGASGVGEVVHAARAGFGGRAGELILAARYVEHRGTRVPLRSLRFGQSGDDRAVAAFVASSLVLPLGFMMSGGNVEVPAGTRANAKVSAAIEVPVN